MTTTTVDGGGVSGGVGRTALGAAMARAMESRRADRLFHDPYAAAFLAAARDVVDPAERGAVAISGASTSVASFWAQVVLRTRYFDDFLVGAAAGGVRQIVVLAAGLDTRAYRLKWPEGVRLFEVDRPDVFAFKRRVLDARARAPRCELHRVGLDLREDLAPPLLEAGWRAETPTAWLLEGLLIYLLPEEVRTLLMQLDRLSSAGSLASFECGADAEDLRARAGRLPTLTQYAQLWEGGMSDAPGWLAGQGWQVETRTLAEVAERHGRTGDPRLGGFVTATKLEVGPGLASQDGGRVE